MPGFKTEIRLLQKPIISHPLSIHAGEEDTMLLYLVQHGEAKPAEEDPERRLTDRGSADVEKIAARLAGVGVRPHVILHSGKTRARQTAELFSEGLIPPGGVREADDLDPLAGSSVWAGRLAVVQDDTMLVGHLPHLAKLAASLLCGDETKTTVAFRMGAVVCLERGAGGAWSLRWMITPEMVA
jgi:phosphohistidine phosphatase